MTQIFIANIYVFHCTVKQSLLKKKSVKDKLNNSNELFHTCNKTSKRIQVIQHPLILPEMIGF